LDLFGLNRRVPLLEDLENSFVEVYLRISADDCAFRDAFHRLI
jgi:hypothetical protein